MVHASGPPGPGLQRRDVVAMLLLVAAYALAVAALPIAHAFAYLDDWTYAQSVSGVLAGQGFQPSEYAQATLLVPTLWGALFASAFGYSFTALTAATMTLSLVGALTFYALLRRLGFAPGLAGLGVAILVLNPYYLVLSYSFMTEIPFVALLLLSSLCLFAGLQTDRAAWLWAGSAWAAGAFLTRQFGLVLPLAALLWLAWARRLTWQRAVAVALLPALAVAGYALLTHSAGPTLSGSIGRAEIVALLQPFTWLNRAAHFVYLALFLPGLTLPLWRPLRHWKVAAALALGAAAAVYGLWQVKGALVAQGQSTVNDLSSTWLQPPFADPTPIYCLGAGLAVWLAAGLLEQIPPAAVRPWRRHPAPSPGAFLALVAAILFAGTYLVSAGFLDRYWLPILPFLIAAGLRPLRDVPARRLLLRLAALAVVAAYGLAVHLDDYALYSAYWDAGTALVRQGVPLTRIRSYTGWEGYYLGISSLARLPAHDIAQVGRVFPPDLLIDPEWVIGPAVPPGYTLQARYPYPSLRGGQQEAILVSRRGGSP